MKNVNYKRAICFITSIAIFGAGINFSAGAKVNPINENLTLHAYTLKNVGDASKTGYQKMEFVDNEGNIFEKIADNELSKASGVTYPASYSLVDKGFVTTPKDQGSWNICWSFASTSSAETSLIKKNLVDVNKVDFSERHLAYFAHRQKLGASNDGEDLFYEGYGYYGGGNYHLAIYALSIWNGVAFEKDFPYSGCSTTDIIDEKYRNVSEAHLINANWPCTEDEIKYELMNTSSVNCSYKMSDSMYSKNVYHSKEEAPDHMVAIVGWDDNYKASNFKSPQGVVPSSDGAWLCKNSWGKTWGNNGYFWLSYEDKTLDDFCSFDMDSKDNFDNNYYYDGAGCNGILGVSKTANVFKAKSKEDLSGVSFYAADSYDYNIEVYVSENKMNNPEDGTKVLSQNGGFNVGGYHTVNLEDSVRLNKDMYFSVIVELSKSALSQDYVCSLVEMNEDYSASAGESFIFEGDWIDNTTKPSGLDVKNNGIKAFTKNVVEEETTTVKEEITTVKEETTTVKEEPTTVKEGQTTSKEELTTVKEGQTTSKEGQTTSKEESTTKEGQTTSKEEPTTVKEGQTTSKEEPTTVKEGQTTSKEEPTTVKEGQTTSKEELTTKEGQTTSKEDATTKEGQTAGKEETTTNEDVTTVKEDQTTLKEEPTTVKEGQTTSKEETTTIKESQTTSKEDATAKEEQTTVKEETTTKEEQTTSIAVTLKKPAIKSIVKTTSKSAVISWNKVANASGYKIYAKMSGKYKLLKNITKPSTTKYAITKLSEQKYSYKIKAYTKTGSGNVYSKYSSAKSIDMRKCISPDELYLQSKSVTLKVKKSKTVKVKYPSKRQSTQIKKISYKSSNKKIATVNSKGKMCGKKKGKATINITVYLKSGLKAKLKVKVNVKK